MVQLPSCFRNSRVFYEPYFIPVELGLKSFPSVALLSAHHPPSEELLGLYAFPFMWQEASFHLILHEIVDERFRDRTSCRSSISYVEFSSVIENFSHPIDVKVEPAFLSFRPWTFTNSTSFATHNLDYVRGQALASVNFPDPISRHSPAKTSPSDIS